MREETKNKVIAVKRARRGPNAKSVVDACKVEGLSVATYYSYYKTISVPRATKNVPTLHTIESDGHDTPIQRQSKVLAIIGTPDEIAEILRKGMN